MACRTLVQQNSNQSDVKRDSSLSTQNEYFFMTLMRLRQETATFRWQFSSRSATTSQLLKSTSVILFRQLGACRLQTKSRFYSYELSSVRPDTSGSSAPKDPRTDEYACAGGVAVAFEGDPE